MKNTFKYLVNCLLSVFLCFSLFLFPVFAYVPTSRLLSPSGNPLNSIQQNYFCDHSDEILSYNYILFDKDSNSLWFGTVTRGPYDGNWNYYWSVRNVLHSNGSVSSDSGWFSYNDNIIAFRFSFGPTNFDDTTNLLSDSCSVAPTPTPTPTPEATPDPTPTPTPPPEVTPTPDVSPDSGGSDGWEADFSNILSNSSVSDLVGYAYDNSIDSWYINYAVYRTPNGLSGYTTKTMGYKYYYRLYDSNDNLLRSVVSDEISGIECNNNDSSVCRPLIAYTVEIVDDTVLRSSWLKPLGTVQVNDSKGNELIESGNSVSQSVSSSLNSTNDQLTSAVSSYDEIERSLTDDFKISVDSIDTGFSWGSNFLNAANFVRTSFNELVEPEPIYNLILFSLILGFSLFIIGRLR